MNTSDAYRASAEACLKLAAVVNDPHSKQVLAGMAEAWLRLADYVERRKPSDMGGHLGGNNSGGNNLGGDNSHDRDANPE